MYTIFKIMCMISENLLNLQISPLLLIELVHSMLVSFNHYKLQKAVMEYRLWSKMNYIQTIHRLEKAMANNLILNKSLLSRDHISMSCRHCGDLLIEGLICEKCKECVEWNTVVGDSILQCNGSCTTLSVKEFFESSTRMYGTKFYYKPILSQVKQLKLDDTIEFSCIDCGTVRKNHVMSHLQRKDSCLCRNENIDWTSFLV